MDTRTWDVVALGEAMVEFNQTTPGQPQYLQGFGGDTSNAAIAAARAGARTAYLTRIGADSFGRSLLQLWAQEGVNTS
ncbi:MAG: sugar kinase, partial [Rhodoferax sp.]|nr:sugar kinase [Rhodoferax sp.]